MGAPDQVRPLIIPYFTILLFYFFTSLLLYFFTILLKNKIDKCRYVGDGYIVVAIKVGIFPHKGFGW